MDEPKRPTRYERPTMPFERDVSPLMKVGRFAGAGLEFGLSVVLFFLGGQALDDYLQSTDPWMKVVGAMVGVGVGTWLLVRPFLRAGGGDDSGGD